MKNWWYAKVGIRGQLLAAFMALLVIALIGLLTVIQLSRPYVTNIESLLATHKLVVKILDKALSNETMEESLSDYVISQNSEERALYIETLKDYKDLQSADFLDATLRLKYEQLHQAELQLAEMRRQVLSSVDSNNTSEARAIMQSVRYSTLESYLRQGFVDIDTLQNGYISELVARNDEVSRQVWAARYIFIGIIALSCIFFALLFSNYFVRRLRHLEKAVWQIGRGNLTVRAVVDRQDEVGRLAVAFNKMAYTLEQKGAAMQDELRQISRDVDEKD